MGGYHRLEIDVTDALDPDRASYYQTLIRMMRWMVELRRVDIATECSLLSSHLAYPREGPFECALNMMDYLKAKHNSRLLFRHIQQSILTVSMTALSGKHYVAT